MSFVERGLERDRIAAGIGVIAVHALLAWALISGLRIGVPQSVRDELKSFNVLPAPPPPPPEKFIPQRIKSKKAEGKASPPNLRSKATDVTAPKPVIPLPVPPPIVVAPKPGPGVQVSNGAADVPGPGTGAGGIGSGFGSGGRGNGEGGEDDNDTPPRLVKGRVGYADLPASIKDARMGAAITVLYTVETNGRVSDCAVEKSSGNAELDRTICPILQQRFRYKPSRDAQNRPIASQVERDLNWYPYEGKDSDTDAPG